METIHFLWIGKTLPEQYAKNILTFVDFGYKCTLWSYNDFSIKKVKSADANKIMPLDNSIQVLLFADYFRLKLLYKVGGWWSDCDNVCVQELPETDYYFNTYRGSTTINNNLMKAPKGCLFLQNCIEKADSLNWKKLSAGTLNFGFFREFTKGHNLKSYIRRKSIIKNKKPKKRVEY